MEVEEAQFYGRDLSLRMTLTSTETHFYEGGSFLRRRLIFTEDVHFNGGDSFPQRTHFLLRRLIPTKALVFAE